MSLKQDKAQLKELKTRLKAANHNRDMRLLRLALVMVILAFVAAVMQGRIQLW